MPFLRGEIWSADLEPQTHKAEPAKRGRPVLVIQTDILNNDGHPTTIVIPGTSQQDGMAPDNTYPLRVRVQKTGSLTYDTDLMVDQVRAISNKRFMEKLCVVTENHLKRIEQALRILTGR